jgi:SOS-response transcriptional repressor LexA
MKEQLQKTSEKVNSKTGLIETPAIDYTRTITLPILGEISAGPRDHIYDLRNLGENIEIPRSLILGTHPIMYMAFRVNGHSMEPNIMHEDLVIVKQETYWENIDQKVCAVRCDDGATLKKVELDPEHNRIVFNTI